MGEVLDNPPWKRIDKIKKEITTSPQRYNFYEGVNYTTFLTYGVWQKLYRYYLLIVAANKLSDPSNY